MWLCGCEWLLQAAPAHSLGRANCQTLLVALDIEVILARPLEDLKHNCEATGNRTEQAKSTVNVVTLD